MSKLDYDDTRNFSLQYQGSLDIGTPPGLFESREGDRYIVSSTSSGKLAIVLKHRSIRSFTELRLGPDEIGFGNSLGDGELEFVHEAPDDDFEHIGTLLNESIGLLSIRCRCEATGMVWSTIADTEECAPQGPFDGWRILKWGRTFFEREAPKAKISPPYIFHVSKPCN